MTDFAEQSVNARRRSLPKGRAPRNGDGTARGQTASRPWMTVSASGYGTTSGSG